MKSLRRIGVALGLMAVFFGVWQIDTRVAWIVIGLLLVTVASVET